MSGIQVSFLIFFPAACSVTYFTCSRCALPGVEYQQTISHHCFLFPCPYLLKLGCPGIWSFGAFAAPGGGMFMEPVDLAGGPLFIVAIGR